MWFFITLVFTFGFSVIVMSIYERIKETIHRRRYLKKYANLPKKILWMDMIKQDVYSEEFHDLRQVLGDDRAATIVIKRMLTDMNIMKYRKEKL